MGWGFGPIQRRILEVLGEDEQTIFEGLPVPEISRRIPGLDKSNRRRATRGLMVRDAVVEEVDPDRGRVIRLGFLGQADALRDLERQARMEERRREWEREEEREQELSGDDADSYPHGSVVTPCTQTLAPLVVHK